MNIEEINNIDVNGLIYLGFFRSNRIGYLREFNHCFIYKNFLIKTYMFLTMYNSELKIIHIDFYINNIRKYNFVNDILTNNKNNMLISYIKNFSNNIYKLHFVNNDKELSEDKIISLYTTYIRKRKIEKLLK